MSGVGAGWVCVVPTNSIVIIVIVIVKVKVIVIVIVLSTFTTTITILIYRRHGSLQTTADSYFDVEINTRNMLQALLYFTDSIWSTLCESKLTVLIFALRMNNILLC